jgi:hypothetical protein
MENLLTNNSDKINEIIIMWECQFLQKREEPIIKSILELQVIPHPRFRLQPRSVVRGAYFDVFRLKWSKELFTNEAFYYCDINGLYSFVTIKFKFMTGPYKIIMGSEINKINICNNKFYYENKKIMGSILLTIIPPSTLFLPFLLYRRKKDLKTFNTLCQLCCENETQVCNHTDIQRSITASYMISEIEYALSLNYKIIAIHECHIFTEASFFLKPFIQALNFFKTKNSNCFQNCKSLEEKQTYCNKLNEKMELQEPFLLTPNNVNFNPAKRNFFKLNANSLFGKFQEKNNKNRTVYACNSKEIEDFYFSNNKIEDIFCINENLCELQICPNEFKQKPNRKNNLYIGAQITAYSQQIIHEHAMKLNQLNYKLFQINCDSILFSMPKNEIFPLEISDIVGDFKFEITKEIVTYTSLGTKCYSITFNENGNFKTTSKICGLSIQGKEAEKILLDEKLFNLYLLQFSKNKCIKKNLSRTLLQRF